MTKDPTPAIRRHPERSVEETSQIYDILDEGFICHVAFEYKGRPSVIPTFYARHGDSIVLHGSTGSGMARAAQKGVPMAVAVTHIDALVVARSAFNSSANYRSVVIHGIGRLLEGEEKLSALDRTVEGLIPGRLPDVRESRPEELRQTAVVEIPLDTVTAKARSGPPSDEDFDLNTGVWAGLVPLRLKAGDPIPAPDLEDGIEVPSYVKRYSRPGAH